MAKETRSTVVPRLRFAKFTGRKLREVQFKDVTVESTIRNGDKLPTASVMGVTKAKGIVPMEERLIASDIARYKIVQRDWFAYNPMRLNIGSIARWQGEADILVSPDYVVFKCLDDASSGVDPAYLDHFRQSVAWNDFVTEGGDGSVRVRVYYKDLARLRLVLPTLAEQQKIADCLTSLDEVIAAQGRKVEALRTYKRGLMRQIFPCEGETRPRLRFTEFRDGPGWEEETLRGICERIMDGTHFSPKSKSGPRPYLTSKNIREGRLDLSNLSYISDDEHREIYARCPVKKLDVLLTKDGANTGNCAINTLEHEFSLLSSVAVLRGQPSLVTQDFLYQWLASERMQKTIVSSMSGQAITRITLEKLENYAVPLPNLPEQQRVAGCLSALDAKTAGESTKLDVLKALKKGLMQQLFPLPEEGL